MPDQVRRVSHTRITANQGREIEKLKRRPTSGFDPTENPVIIGSNGVSLTADPTDVSTGAVDAVALNARADGTGSVSIGRALAYADYSICIGPGVVSSGATSAIAIGASAQVSSGATNGIALGANAFAEKPETIGIGTEADPAQDYCIAIGYFSLAGSSTTTNTAAVAIGKQAKATKVNSIAIGNGAQANGDNSIAIGAGVLVAGTNIIQIGSSTQKVTIVGTTSLNGPILTGGVGALPTSNPGVSGQLWNNAGVVTVS